MDRQRMQPGGGGGSGAATQEWLYPGAGAGGQQPAQVVDGKFLMELLDQDAPATEQPQEDVDQLSRVIQSLEAEIDGIRPPAASAPANGGDKTECVSSDVDGGLLDDMLSDLDSSPGPCVADDAMPSFEYWPEVGPHDMGSWYLDGDGVMVGAYEFREQCYYGYGDSLAVDQVYSPLWE
ncbi:hypothetical protein PR202_gb27624 [Eleusine coracana subsp. coracana]|uniref:Uncharacterized protein n=1 Tax=Eleusine coracana subsp. coracana TaxID=191504 RepID=A0AAV5FUT1_ELECO|nr:hypothetical protein QOZ80_6AG0542130 [Eleusine coracana subsp. coracana]GJN38569.1 hypothetical protein PR202_gb27624 [Eleusine coracana subsp. coracana]